MTAGPTTHEQRHRAIVDRIVEELQPVRPRWPIGWRLALWLVLDLVVAVWVVSGTRVDIAAKLHSPSYVFELVFFSIAATLAAMLALRSAMPAQNLGKSELVAMLTLAVAGILALGVTPFRTDYQLEAFVRTGVPCACMTALIAMAPWIGLAWAVRRGAPLRGFVSGALVGSGALLFSFTMMRIDCPIDEPVHLITWHLMPAVTLIGVSTIAGGWWMRFRPSNRVGLRAA